MATAKRKTTKKSAVKKTTAKKTPAKRVAKKVTSTRKKPVVKRTAAPKAATKTVAETVAVSAAAPSVEQAFTFGNDMFKKFFDASNMPSMPAMPDASAFGQQFSGQGAEQLAKASSAASKSMNDAIELSKENAEAVIESSNIAAGASKTVGAELFNYANKAFSQNVEISKELFACRTLNDMFDLQSRVMKNNLDGFFSESVKLSELMFEAANNAAEPIQERIQDAAERVNKTLNEAA